MKIAIKNFLMANIIQKFSHKERKQKSSYQEKNVLQKTEEKIVPIYAQKLSY